jgi:HEAT repeat protein
MEDKEAIEILMKLLDKHSFTEKEKKAIATAIGALGWTKLGKARLKNIINARKAERAEENKWQ